MIKRRHFLQFTGSTLATLGLNHLDIIQQGNRYAQVLAQNTPRKLALLVGINKYPNNPRYSNLNGCITDVDLQQELLIHRFGFNKSDILRLTSDESPNKQPTRSNILTAFEEHLIKQAKPGDVVVFHFSGHGARLLDPNPIQNCSNKQFNDRYNSSLVVADETQQGSVPDIMGSTLFLLMSVRIQREHPDANVEVWTMDEQTLEDSLPLRYRLGLKPVLRTVWASSGEQPIAKSQLAISVVVVIWFCTPSVG